MAKNSCRMMDRYSQVVSSADLGMDIWDVTNVWRLDSGRRERGRIEVRHGVYVPVQRMVGDNVWHTFEK